MAWTMPPGAVLGIFAKQPTPGQVKTRLAERYGPETAAAIHEAMLFDSLDLWGSGRFLDASQARLVLVYQPEDAGPWFDQRVAANWALQPQTSGDLGQRMRSFFEGELAEGASKVVLIGSDSPTLDPSIVISAFLCLEARDAALGPATDGGYYLVGCRNAVPPIFDGVAWGTSAVLGQTVDRLTGSGLSVGVLPPWCDIDRPDDWTMLQGHLRAMRLAGIDPGLPRTEALALALASK